MKKQITVKDLIKITKGKLVIGEENETCEKFSFDTRQLDENDTYVGIKGQKIDGNTLWKEAFDKGAKIAIVENTNFTYGEIAKYQAQGKIIIKVDNTVKALAQVAEYKRKLYNIPVVGITGSVGKTSTKDIIASVLSQKYNTLKTEGNNNNYLGLPKTILKLKNEKAAVIEMGMNNFGEIKMLTNIAKPTLAVITNIGTSHIGKLGSRQNILKAKLEILQGMEEKRIIINNDNDLLHKWYQENKNKYEIITFGILNQSDFMAEDIILDENGSTFICKANSRKIQIDVPIAGEHYIYNALCAIAVGKTLNLTNQEIINGIKEVQLSKKRMEITELKNNVKLINDTYNASYESIKEALKYINNLHSGKKIVALGDVLELGEFSEEIHRKIGDEVVKQKVDILICCGPNSKYICQSAIEHGMKKDMIYFEKNIENVTKRIQKTMKKGDVVLLKASNGMGFSNIASQLIEKNKN